MSQNELSAGRSALLLTFLGILSQMAAFCYRVALSRMVGAEIMGLYQLLMSAYSVIVALTATGVTAATSQLTAQYLALHNRRGADSVRKLALQFFILASIPIAVAVCLLSDSISVHLLGDARTQLGLILLLPCALLTGIENIHKHFFYGAGLVKSPAITELLEQLIRGMAVLGLLFFLPPMYAEIQAGLIILGMVLCEICSALMLTTLYRHYIHKHPLKGAGEKPFALRRKVLAVAIPVSLNAILGNFIAASNSALLPRKLVEGGLTRSEALSEFGVVCGMTLPMLALPTVLLGSMSLILIPRLSRCIALNRPDLIRHYVHRALLAVSASMLPAMGVMAVIGEDLGVLLFGPQGAESHLLPLVFAMALSCYHATFSSILNGIARQSSATIISLFCGSVQLIITLVAVPVWGMTGYIFGILFSSFLGALFSGIRVFAVTKIPPHIFQHFTAPALAAALMALCGNLLHLKLQEAMLPTPIACCITVVFCAILYVAALQGQGLSLKEIFRLSK